VVFNFNSMENNNLALFNLCLKSVKEEKGLNLSEIADKLMITPSYLSKIKGGKKPISNKLLHQMRTLAGMTNSKAISKVLNPYKAPQEANEPQPVYQTQANESAIINHIINENSAKTLQIDQLIAEISKAQTTIAILAAKIKE
jgi:transcriptional regulator with XRE-family HTH domain